MNRCLCLHFNPHAINACLTNWARILQASAWEFQVDAKLDRVKQLQMQSIYVSHVTYFRKRNSLTQ